MSAHWPSPRQGWTLVALLFAAYIISFIDRQILSLMVDPIRSDLGLTDVQIGLVGGLAFGVFYSIMGLPLGWMADRTNRLRLVAAGIAVWSIATAACGLAANFLHLFAARVLVGIAEAVLAPAAMSLIADSFPPERRALPVSTFVMAGSIGGGAAMILGGIFLGWFSALDTINLPVIGYRHAWQAVFIAVGLPGVLIAAGFLALREPVRRSEADRVLSDRPALLPFLRAERAVLLPLVIAMSLLATVAYGFLTWIPTHFMRGFGWTAQEVGTLFGSVFLISGALGAWSGGASAMWLSARGNDRANLLVVASGLTALVLPAAAATAIANAELSLALLAPVMFLFAFPSGVAVAAIQSLTSSTLTGRVIAIYYIVMNLVGLSTGAVLVAAIASLAGGPANGISMALSIVAVVLVPIAALCAWKAFVSASKADQANIQ